MPNTLLALAEQEKIIIEYWDFDFPVDAMYVSNLNLPPIIAISKRVITNNIYFRCVLAEELGHHFTTVDNMMPRAYFQYCDRVKVNRTEYRALRWAALCLIPPDKLNTAFEKGVKEPWELAEYFEVTEQFMCFRLRLPDVVTKKLLPVNYLVLITNLINVEGVILSITQNFSN